MFNLFIIETEGRAKSDKFLQEAEVDQVRHLFRRRNPKLRQRIGNLLVSAGQKLQADHQPNSAAFTPGAK